jgi:tetratricopeptide (TPR) repeat protein
MAPARRVPTLGLVLVAALLALPAAAGATACGGQHGGHGAGGAAAVDAPGPLGRIDFPTSAGAEAQRHFLRGVLWLHNFEYQDARAEFLEAQRVEPGFAMAVWGEAMTHNHPIWVRGDADAGRTALEKLGETPEKRLAAAPTERERGWLEAVERLYFTDGDKPARDRAYAEAMERLHRGRPDDHEAAAFYALALLGTSQGEREFPVSMQAAAVVEEVYLVNPEHPGALHYLIHSYDEAVHAPLGLRAARRYAEVASAAPHALHMPSHIFFALGLWGATEASNRESWQAALDRGDKGYHALSWLHYALLQQGRLDEAAELYERAAAEAEEDGGSAGQRASMGAVQWIETRGRAALPEVETDGLSIDTAVTALFARGYRASLAGDAAGARAAAAAIRDRAEGETGRSAGGAAISADQLEALALLAGDDGGGGSGDGGGAGAAAEEALSILRAAAAAEDALSLDIGPPHPVKPSYELLGETLIRLGRPAEAQAAFERALDLAPGRRLSLQGLAEAAAAAGDAETAAEAQGRLNANARL